MPQENPTSSAQAAYSRWRMDLQALVASVRDALDPDEHEAKASEKILLSRTAKYLEASGYEASVLMCSVRGRSRLGTSYALTCDGQTVNFSGVVNDNALRLEAFADADLGPAEEREWHIHRFDKPGEAVVGLASDQEAVIERIVHEHLQAYAYASIASETPASAVRARRARI